MVVVELGIFFEQVFVDVEVECFGFVVEIVGFDVVDWEFVDLVVLVEYVEQCFVVYFWFFCDEFFGLDFFDLKVFGEFYELLEI